MRKLIALMHVSLDGYCAGPKGEMDWITLNDAIFADVHAMIAGTGAAVYGRNTYGMMRGYWPTLLDKEDADPAQRAHARWVEQIPKLTFSRTLEGHDWNNVRLLRDAGEMAALKQEEGAPMLIFGSPGLTRAFMASDLIDEYWLYQNPVLLGAGIAYFHAAHRTRLTLVEAKPFAGGVVRLHYANAHSGKDQP
jgi:dihydrofolate reductase